MKRITKQKEIERRAIEWARNQSTLIPNGELQQFERPDWLIPSAQLAIEVSELLPQKPRNAAFSSPQLSAFQKEVVCKAERCYREIDPRPAKVQVYFKNDWARKRDEDAMATEIAQFVQDNYPANAGRVLLQELTHGVRSWFDGLSVVGISCVDEPWDTSASSFIPILTYDHLHSRIRSKDQRLPEYRARVHQDWEIFLLLATRISVLHSVAVPSEVTMWEFESRFDRVLLSPWDGGVIQLNTSPSQT